MKLKLTLAKVESAKPPKDKNQAFLWDTTAKGLGLRVTMAGAKSYVYQYRTPGKSAPTRETLGSISALTLEEARALVYGRILTPAPKERSNAPTLLEVLEHFKRARVGVKLKPATAAQYEYFLQRYVADWLDKPVTTIEPDHIVARHTDIGQSGAYAANYTIRILRALFNYAQAAYDILADWQPPLARLLKTKGLYPEQRRQTLLRGKEVGLFFNAVRLHPAPSARTYMQFCLLTGCRPNEAATLAWQDVKLDDRYFSLADPKNHKPVYLPIGTFLAEQLTALKQLQLSDDWVFPSRRGSGPLRDVRKALTASCKRAGLPTITPYDFRRTYATIADGLDLKDSILKKLLNHRTGQSDVTQGYIVGEVERLRKPQQRIERLILQVASQQLPEVDRRKQQYYDDETQSWESLSPALLAWLYANDARATDKLFEDYETAYPEFAR